MLISRKSLKVDVIFTVCLLKALVGILLHTRSITRSPKNYTLSFLLSGLSLLLIENNLKKESTTALFIKSFPEQVLSVQLVTLPTSSCISKFQVRTLKANGSKLVSQDSCLFGTNHFFIINHSRKSISLSILIYLTLLR